MEQLGIEWQDSNVFELLSAVFLLVNATYVNISCELFLNLKLL